MSIKLIAIDMDATLLRDDKTYDTHRFKKVLDFFEERGVKVCIATGNSCHRLHTLFDDEEHSRLYLAGDNGNQIMKHHEELKIQAIEPTTYQAIIQFLASHSGYYPGVCTGSETYIEPNLPMEMERYIRQYNPNTIIIDNLLTNLMANPPIKIAVASQHTLAENKLMVQTINDLFPELQAVTSGELWIDIYHKDGGKGSAIQYLQHKYGISSEESMAFGDSLNDETMIKAVEYSIAMGNADPDLVAFCQYQIGTNEEQAVLDVLEQLTSETNLAFMQQYKIIR